MKKLISAVSYLWQLCAVVPLLAAGPSATDRFAGHEQFVAGARAASLQQREHRLRQTIAEDSAWPHGPWGDTVWCLAALRLNERTEEANARLLDSARSYIALFTENPDAPALTPHQRPRHSFWSVQHECAPILQRIANERAVGSCATGRIGIRFEGTDLEKTDEDGWIFATNGQAFAGVKFLHPETVYESPILHGKFGGDRFTVKVSPITRVLDFSETGE